MRTAGISEVKAKLSQFVADCEAQGPVVITRNGKPVAVLVSAGDDDDLERMILAHSPKFQAILAKSRKSIAAGRFLKHNDFWKKVRQRSK